MFRASSAHLQDDRVVYMQHMVLSLCKHVSDRVLQCINLVITSQQLFQYVSSNIFNQLISESSNVFPYIFLQQVTINT